MKCHSCLSLSGEKPLFPESRMYDGNYWVAEHTYPVGIMGWIVLILKRHTESLHELTYEEFQELSMLQNKLSIILRDELHCKKEYSVCFAEAEGFAHIHFHFIAIPENLPKKYKGPRIFLLLGSKTKETVKKEDIILFCQKVKKRLETESKDN